MYASSIGRPDTRPDASSDTPGEAGSRLVAVPYQQRSGFVPVAPVAPVCS